MNLNQKLPFILYRDERWLVVDKPCGLPTHGGDEGDVGVQEWMQLHCDLQTFVCSRLDIETSGVLLFALTAESSAQAQSIHIEERAQKIYYFLSDVDVRSVKGAHWTCGQVLDGKDARSEFYFDCQIAPRLFRYRAVIKRGRTHQIRRHAAFSGCPLLGDPDYGGSNAPRLALHCAQLQWPGLPEKIESPLPAFFNSNVYSRGKAIVESFVALEKRACWLPAITSAWRAVQRGELSDFDLSIDLYGQHALIWVYDQNEFQMIFKNLEEFFSELKNRFGLEGIVFRRIAKNPHQKGLVLDLFVMGQNPPEQFIVSEHEWKLWVTLTLRQHVGLFLDHRDNRRRVQKLARGKRVANLFSYTCAFGLASAMSDCEVVMNVDAAASSLNLGKKNFELNDLNEKRTGKFIEKDVRLWLEKQIVKCTEKSDQGWDIIICDPPTFSLTQKMGRFHVDDEWLSLADSCARILKPQGICFFSTNCQSSDRTAFEKKLKSVFHRVQRLRPPLDFPEIPSRTHAYFFECREPRY